MQVAKLKQTMQNPLFLPQFENCIDLILDFVVGLMKDLLLNGCQIAAAA
jgi:hypothetical protein